MSSMEHQEVNLGQQQNQDLIWDLDSIARRELAERFIKLFENRLCVYSESTRQLYTNYNLHFPSELGRKMVVLPNPYAFHDTLHGIDPVAVRKTGLFVLPGVVLGKPGLLLTTQIRDGGPAPKTMPFKPALAQIISNQKKIGDVFLPILMKGDLREFDRYNIGWVKDTVSNVDFVNGFIEDYGDPLGRKASWEGIVNFMDKEACHRTEVISDNAQWFEDHSPVAPAYRKEKVKGVSAKVITVAMLGGDCYPATPIGINLPNADWIRKEYGSKSVTIDNITYAYDMAAHGNGFNEEFVLRAGDREVMDKYGKLADDLHTDLHECLGHGSGQLAPGVKGNELKSYSSTLEETRADLFGLYYLGDPKLVELGLIPSLDVAKAG